MTRTSIWMAVVCAMVVGGVGCGSESGDYGDDDGSAATSSEPGPGINGCDPASAEDHTGEDALTITNDGFSYSPACVRVSAGTTITFASNFAAHPLSSGDAASGRADEGSPILATSEGTSVDFTFAEPGTWGFYCQVHAPGMAGVVFVE